MLDTFGLISLLSAGIAIGMLAGVLAKMTEQHPEFNRAQREGLTAEERRRLLAVRKRWANSPTSVR